MEDTTRYEIRASRTVAAPAARVYDIIADYRNGHPHIVPPNFTNIQVVEGGRGAGTVIRFEARAFGRTQTIRHRVDEPEPGRVLVEHDLDAATVTSFTVDRGAREGESAVTISTMMTSRPGLLGAIERALTRTFLQRLYRQELANLEAFARSTAFRATQ